MTQKQEEEAFHHRLINSSERLTLTTSTMNNNNNKSSSSSIDHNNPFNNNNKNNEEEEEDTTPTTKTTNSCKIEDKEDNPASLTETANSTSSTTVLQEETIPNYSSSIACSLSLENGIPVPNSSLSSLSSLPNNIHHHPSSSSSSLTLSPTTSSTTVMHHHRKQERDEEEHTTATTSIISSLPPPTNTTTTSSSSSSSTIKIEQSNDNNNNGNVEISLSLSPSSSCISNLSKTTITSKEEEDSSCYPTIEINNLNKNNNNNNNNGEQKQFSATSLEENSSVNSINSSSSLLSSLLMSNNLNTYENQQVLFDNFKKEELSSFSFYFPKDDGFFQLESFLKSHPNEFLIQEFEMNFQLFQNVESLEINPNHFVRKRKSNDTSTFNDALSSVHSVSEVNDLIQPSSNEYTLTATTPVVEEEQPSWVSELRNAWDEEIINNMDESKKNYFLQFRNEDDDDTDDEEEQDEYGNLAKKNTKFTKHMRQFMKVEGDKKRKYFSKALGTSSSSNHAFIQKDGTFSEQGVGVGELNNNNQQLMISSPLIGGNFNVLSSFNKQTVPLHVKTNSLTRPNALVDEGNQIASSFVAESKLMSNAYQRNSTDFSSIDAMSLNNNNKENRDGLKSPVDSPTTPLFNPFNHNHPHPFSNPELISGSSMTSFYFREATMNSINNNKLIFEKSMSNCSSPTTSSGTNTPPTSPTSKTISSNRNSINFTSHLELKHLQPKKREGIFKKWFSSSNKKRSENEWKEELVKYEQRLTSYLRESRHMVKELKRKQQTENEKMEQEFNYLKRCHQSKLIPVFREFSMCKLVRLKQRRELEKGCKKLIKERIKSIKEILLQLNQQLKQVQLQTDMSIKCYNLLPHYVKQESYFKDVDELLNENEELSRKWQEIQALEHLTNDLYIKYQNLRKQYNMNRKTISKKEVTSKLVVILHKYLEECVIPICAFHTNSEHKDVNLEEQTWQEFINCIENEERLNLEQDFYDLVADERTEEGQSLRRFLKEITNIGLEKVPPSEIVDYIQSFVNYMKERHVITKAKEIHLLDRLLSKLIYNELSVGIEIHRIEMENHLEENIIFQQQTKLLRKLTPSQLGVANKFTPIKTKFTGKANSIKEMIHKRNMTPFNEPITVIGYLNYLITPHDLLHCIYTCAKQIHLIAKENCNARGKEFSFGADEFFPILVYVVVHSYLPNIHSILSFLSKYSGNVANSEVLYYLTCLEGAVMYVQEITENDIKELTKDEKNHFFQEHDQSVTFTPSPPTAGFTRPRTKSILTHQNDPTFEVVRDGNDPLNANDNQGVNNNNGVMIISESSNSQEEKVRNLFNPSLSVGSGISLNDDDSDDESTVSECSSV
ncbi:hypothetical protein ABK040_003964 [Willaertia magna]